MSTLTLPAGQPLLAPFAPSSPERNDIVLDEGLYEIVDGQRVEMPPMSIFSVWLAGKMFVSLANFVNAQNLGRVVTEGLFILTATGRLQRRPDVAFVSAKTWPLDRPLPATGDWQVTPDLTVEVVSPNDLFEDVLKKVIEYITLGVKKVWAVSPGTSKVLVFHSPTKVDFLGSDDELDGGDVVPGFRLKLTELFASV